MNCCRVGVAWLFLIATIVAQGPHRHDEPAPQFAEAFGTCNVSGPHWAGHELTAEPDSATCCPLCQLRNQPMLVEPTALVAEPIGTPVRFDVALPQITTGPTLRIRCRAPPEV